MAKGKQAAGGKIVPFPANSGPLGPAKRLPGRPSRGQQARDLPIVDTWTSHPGHGLSPRKIVEIFRAAEWGYTTGQCDLFADVVERDGHLKNELEKAVDAVAGKAWQLQAGGDRPEDQTAAVLLEQALRLVPAFQETLEHQLTALWYGFAPTEIVWDLVDGVVVPARFIDVPHRRLTFDDTDCPRLIVDENLHKGEELEPGKWWLGHRRGRPARAGVLRTAVWLSFFKSLSIRDWVIWAERFGLPYVTGEYEDEATDEDKEVLEEAVKQLGSDGSAIFSKACKIVVTQAASGGKADDVHGALASFCNTEMSKLITGSTLTSESGGAGSFALGRVHQDAAFNRQLAEARRLGAQFEEAIGLPFVTFNSLKARPPRLVVHVVQTMDPETRAKVMSLLANEVGLELDEDQVRQEFQVKKPTGTALRGTKGAKQGSGDPPASNGDPS